MKTKIQFIILLILPIIIIIASYFIDSSGLRQGKFISPLGSLYTLTLENDAINIKLSQREKRFIDRQYRGAKSIYITSNELSENSNKTITSLIKKDIISKDRVSFHILGTDHRGRDLLGVLIIATRNNLRLSLIAVLFSVSLGTLIGIFQGYLLNRDTPSYYQKIRSIISFFTNSITSIPMLVWLLICVLFVELILEVRDDYIRTVWTFILMGSVYYSMILSQTIESHIVSLKELEFLSASELMGLSKLQIIVNHIIRTNLAPLLFSQSLLIIIQTIMLEITISFKYIGFGLVNNLSYGTLVNGMFMPQSGNMMIPIIFAGLFCTILNSIISNFQKMNA
jgi:ABC-type dipeptide/oligopeptide/nickel transport system permease subunit|tara:strand:+ start:409 stop:1425 length:1017 start_codon:yes stop_codon:yes gene_type:complete